MKRATLTLVAVLLGLAVLPSAARSEMRAAMMTNTAVTHQDLVLVASKKTLSGTSKKGASSKTQAPTKQPPKK